jgi:Skp family chaperone for outer membrane proteins
MKKTMKIAIILLMWGSFFALHAQPYQRNQAQPDSLKTVLGLSDEQVAKWKALQASHQEERKAMREKHEESRKAMQDDWRTMQEKRQNELKAILTETQYQQWQAIQQKQMEERRAARKGPGGKGYQRGGKRN